MPESIGNDNVEITPEDERAVREMLKQPLSPALKEVRRQCRGRFLAEASEAFDHAIVPLMRGLHLSEIGANTNADPAAAATAPSPPPPKPPNRAERRRQRQKKDKTAAAPPADD